MEIQLYIGGLKEYSQEREIEAYLSKYGKINGLKLYNSYGFISVDQEVGNKILNDTHEINGNKIVVEAAKGARPSKSAYTRGPIFHTRHGTGRRVSRLILENLPKSPDWSEIRSFILMCGARPTYLRILPSGDGLVEFMCRQDRDAALDKLNNQEFHGKNIIARFGRKKSEITTGIPEMQSMQK